MLNGLILLINFPSRNAKFAYYRLQDLELQSHVITKAKRKLRPYSTSHV